ncbi:dethiobiotin synthase [Pectobacterium wasabiae]|uniref:ATP-dependent dethiobiotin synthetase BioD n=1 Tax=Pectobacterium wasabiae TaxID=55208 RepID=A0AAW3EM62_9GAMM|nr:dethiobiotin synthase [Pectobacterium wasabiae]AOR64734.1 dethiobiotin synthase [Pectobacterium wasabiae CFBP 3304]EJS93934.1 ATP-dependent dethiobiotin synthetase BioD 1 [Pectobacterium wasabiae CFBP 3304]KFX09999.1 dethiobiotin synthetase [Pectobacterium wasabiae]KGA30201.1 dethiobiotin synthetase [Pectobacterium wasabiae]
MTERWFVTGTDTEVGKTVASMALLQAAHQAGYRTAGYKPVASGCEMTADGIRNSDALALQANSSIHLDYPMVNPLAFMEPTSPHIISAVEQRPIHLSVLSAGLRELEMQADWVLIEGAGGWFTPLSEQDTFADWVVQEQLPVILVVGIKLGCINHAMLTAHAIQHAGLHLGGWIANDIMPRGKWHQPYLHTLQQRLPAPMLGEIPYLSTLHQHNLGQYIDIGLLAYP